MLPQHKVSIPVFKLLRNSSQEAIAAWTKKRGSALLLCQRCAISTILACGQNMSKLKGSGSSTVQSQARSYKTININQHISKTRTRVLSGDGFPWISHVFSQIGQSSIKIRRFGFIFCRFQTTFKAHTMGVGSGGAVLNATRETYLKAVCLVPQFMLGASSDHPLLSCKLQREKPVGIDDYSEGDIFGGLRWFPRIRRRIRRGGPRLPMAYQWVGLPMSSKWVPNLRGWHYHWWSMAEGMHRSAGILADRVPHFG